MTSRRTCGAPRRPAPALAAPGGRGRHFLLALAAWVFLLGRSHAGATPPEAPPPDADIDEPPSAIETEVEAGESDVPDRRRSLIHWNEIDGPYTTFRVGFGYLVEYAAFSQDEASQEQFDLADDGGVRDARLVFSGRLKTERPISWTLGAMYDGNDEEWFVRQTGFMIGVPELNSRVFIGRTKEGYSMVKVMNGYHPWTAERSPALDAFVPILADGIKWMYYSPERRIHWSLGYFVDELSEEEKFATYDNQAVGRIVWQPVLSESGDRVLHLGAMIRTGNPDEGSLQVRSKPESNLAPYFLDSGRFEADRGTAIGYELFYRKSSWLFGSEYHWQRISAANGEEPLFHAGDAVATWLLTGETRPYNATGGYFGMVTPKKSVFKGGPGAWEAVLRFTYSDFDAGAAFRGGTFWRVTPMMNWYLNHWIRLEFVYGYGELDRFGTTGATQFFQTRLQFAL